jgi:CheY-like chemotaxis protein
MSAPRVLLVDDQREISRMLRSSLELSDREYTVVDVPSGEEALLEISRGPVDLVVADMRLPGISGLELVSKVRQLNPDAHAIMITGHPTVEVRAQAEAMGVVAFLSKPVSPNRFLEAVERAVSPGDSAASPVVISDDRKPRVAERMETALGELGAQAVLLVDDRWRVSMQAGTATLQDLEETLPSLMAAFTAGLKASNLLGATAPENLQYFDGESHELYLTNVGASYALLMVFQGGQEAGQLGSVVLYGRRAADDILALIQPSRSAEKRREDEPPQMTWDEYDTQAPPASKKTEATEADQADLPLPNAGEKVEGAEGGGGRILTYQEAREMGLLSDEQEGDAEGAS